jgi:hydrogenase-4 component B
MNYDPITIALSSVVLLLGTALIAPLFRRSRNTLINISFILASIASFCVVAAGYYAVETAVVSTATLPIGLPGLPFHIRLDALAGFFLVVVGLLSFFVSIYSIGYVKGYAGHRSVTSLVVFYCLFIAGMLMVVLADDAFCFLVAWELMAAASYFLVMFENERAENRKAALLYLVVAHVGAIAILFAFGILAGFSSGDVFSGYTFDAMRKAEIPVYWATAAFFLSFLGFCAKAGVIPLHVWLPEAHPAAPSNVSALMSGVMLKTAIYGIIRVTFDIIHVFPWWWGSIVLTLGLISMVMGVLYALMQHDLKKLLAYHSVENIGIILVGIGLSMIFISFKLPLLAALGLIAGLYHTINHAVFKGLLFMGAGAVLHATGERNMEEMGGLIHKMPWTAAMFLVACLSISALPPFNGFVSEWLTFQAFLLSPALPNRILILLIPLGAALLALSGALAAACFVKAFGVTFLGHWRGHHRPHVHEVDWTMRAGMVMAGVTCLLLGILPTIFIDWVDVIAEQFVGSTISLSASQYGWMWLTPVSYERASYSGIIVFIGILVVVAAAYALLHVKPGMIRRSHIWDCGFQKINSRMQYNATSFAQPIRRIFGFLFRIRESVEQAPHAGHKAFPKKITYYLSVKDRIWKWLYKPIVDSSFWLSRQAGRLQQGRIQTYLLYSFITILALLVFLR